MPDQIYPNVRHVAVALCVGLVGRYWWEHGRSPLRNVAEGSSLAASPVAGEFQVVRVERGDLLIIRQKVQVAGQVERTNLEFPLQLLGVNAADRSAEGTKFSKEFLSSGSPRIDG